MYSWKNFRKQRIVSNRVGFCSSYAKVRSAVSFYSVLGVEKNCDAKQLKTAYLNKCREFHPDTTPYKDWSTEKLREKFQQVQEAYHILSDLEARRRYDTSEKPLRSLVHIVGFLWFTYAIMLFLDLVDSPHARGKT